MYSLWATKQRSKILLSIGGIALVAFSIYITIGMYKPPSCYDSKMNQGELNVDCGGPCSLMCPAQVQSLRTVWSRSFEISPGLWSAFAYVENPNAQAQVGEARYRFSIYDRNNTRIAEREGKTFITQDAILPIFEGRIPVTEGEPYRTKFEWIDPLAWHRVEEVYSIALEEQRMEYSATRPEITASLLNKEPFPLRDIEVFAIVFDTNQNAIGVSKTYVDLVSARGKTTVTFSWTSPFPVTPERWQLIPRVPQQTRYQ